MNLYEHTIIARQDTSPSQLKQIQEKYLLLTKKNLHPVQSQLLINNLLEKNKNISPNQLMSTLKRIRK